MAKREVVSEKLTDIFIAPVKNFTEGLLTLNQLIPVILVTIVEAYLKDVRIYEAQINPKVMEFSEQSVTYADVKRAESIDELKLRRCRQAGLEISLMMVAHCVG